MNPETRIQRHIMLALSNADCIVWRNETGQFWAGKTLHKAQDQVTLGGARMVPCGLCKGSSDLVGIHKPSGRFIAVEVKTPQGRPTKEQLAFIHAVNNAGGIAGIARSPEEALALLPHDKTKEPDE